MRYNNDYVTVSQTVSYSNTGDVPVYDDDDDDDDELIFGRKVN